MAADRRAQSAPSTIAIVDGFTCYAPAAAHDSADYPDTGFALTRDVEERSFWCRARRRLTCALVDRFVGRTRRARLLEIGCGTGFVLEGLATRQSLELTGSEISVAALRYARARLPDVGLVQLDATKNPFTAAFDAIVALDVIEHLDDDAAAVAGVWRALVPGGVFLVSVPQYAWLWSRLDELVRHKRRYARGSLTALLERAGFDVVFSTSFVTMLFPLMVVARILGRRRRHSSGIRGLEREVTFSPLSNALFDRVMRIDEQLIRSGFSLPFGGSLFAVARRR